MRCRFLLLVAAALAVLAPAAHAQKVAGGAGAVLRVACDATFPPMESLDASGAPVGFGVDLAREIAKRIGVAVEFRNVAWDGIFDGLRSGEWDAVVSSVSITPERRAVFDFSEPYFESGTVLVRRRDNAAIGSEADLKNRRAGEVKGTVGAFAMVKYGFGERREYDTFDELFQALDRGELDVALVDKVVYVQFNQAAPYKNRFARFGAPYSVESYGVALRKGSDALRGRIDAALAALRADGTLAALARRWGLDGD